MNARALLAARDELARKIRKIDTVIEEIAVSGTSSASFSSDGGSRSYSHIDLGQLRALRADYVTRLRAVKDTLGGRPSGIQKIMTVRC